MLKLYSYWSRPADEAAFEHHYHEVHLPRAARVPGLQRLVLTKVAGGFEGAEPPNYRVAEMVFADREAFEACTRSPQWAHLREDGTAMLELFGVTLVTEMGEEVVAPLG